MKNKKYKKIWMFSPIIIAGILALLSIIFHWRNMSQGFLVTYSMHPYLHQEANIRLDYPMVDHFIVNGNFEVTISSGKQFEIWVSSFLANYADITQNHTVLQLTGYKQETITPRQAEVIHIIVPQEKISQLTFNSSGTTTIIINDISTQTLILDLLGNHDVILKNTLSDTIRVLNKGSIYLNASELLFKNMQINNLGTIVSDIKNSTSMNIHLKGTGKNIIDITPTDDLPVTSIYIKGIGLLKLNEKYWKGILNDTYLLKYE